MASAESVSIKSNYEELLELEKVSLVYTMEIFECPICCSDVDPGNGLMLRDCLHTFCLECLKSLISHSDAIQIACPFISSGYNCDSCLTDREIKNLVSPEAYQKYLEQSLRKAELQIPNTFHCQTPDCDGFCINDDHRVSVFTCPVCGIVNCLSCEVSF